MPTEFNPEKKMNIQPTDPRVAFSSPDASEDELIWELLSLYVDGEASVQEAAQVEQMLRHDAEYARAYAFMQKAGTTIRTIVEIEPPSHLRDAILAKTSHRPTFSQRLGVAVLALRTQFAMPIGRMVVVGGSLALIIGICAGRMGSVNSLPTQPVVASISVPAKTVFPSPTAPVIIVPSRTSILRDEHKQALVEIKRKSVGKTDNGIHNAVGPVTPEKSAPLLIANAQTHVTPRVITSADLQTKPLLVPKSYHLPPPRPQFVGNTQNVNPMMDTAVYHIRANSDTARPAADNEDDLNDDHLVTSRDHEEVPDSVVTKTETETTPAAGHKMEGKLVLSKLPPSSRHILSPGEVARQANSAAVANYNAASSDDTQGRPAELRVLTGKF